MIYLIAFDFELISCSKHKPLPSLTRTTYRTHHHRKVATLPLTKKIFNTIWIKSHQDQILIKIIHNNVA